ncbi:polysaccharide biosynthesis/export family protein [Kamptonema cortianum]|nr:polysaccharide biosynthesis/export family protein [Geitlerinema splendidum]MDK3162495.1 polysaccharide biosynthesis/export family protein [Kamptonema cortianum]
MVGTLALAIVQLALSQQVPQAEPVKIAVGDVIRVELFGVGDPDTMTVMPDGAVSAAPYGRVVVAGLTIPQAEKLITERSKQFVRDPKVFITIISQREKFVIIVGEGLPSNRVKWQEGMDLRGVVTSNNVLSDSELLEVRLFRNGKEEGKVAAKDLLVGKPNAYNPTLMPDDVVSIAPVPMVRVWLLERFVQAGEKLIPAGSSLAQAVAAGGGPMTSPPPGVVIDEPTYFQEMKIRVVRGGQSYEFRTDDIAGMADFKVESGDSISVVAPRLTQISVAGYVVQPGSMAIVEGADVLDAITKARGPNELASLENVLVVRNGSIHSVDLSKIVRGQTGERFPVKEGDLIIVQENKKAVYVLGDVRQPQRLIIQDGETLTAAEALGRANGLMLNGTLRRVMLARKDDKGEFKVMEFNLDEFLKDGKLEANPTLQPGDFLVFGQPKGFTADTLLRVIPSIILLQNLRF